MPARAYQRLGVESRGVTLLPHPNGALPLAGLFEEFIDGFRYDRSPRTLAAYENYIGRGFAPWLEARNCRRLDELTSRHIERYLGELHTRLAPVSVRKAYNQIHRFCVWCIERRYSAENPCAVVRPPKVPEGTRQGFDDDEVKRLVRVTDAKTGITGIRDRAILAVMLDTGVRASELCNLRLSDIDWPRHRLLVHLGKGQKDRWLPLGAETQRRLKLWLRVRWDHPSDRVWLTLRREPFTYGALNSSFLKLGEYAGVTDCTPHRTRHTFSAAYYRAHKDVIALQQLLGHADIGVTMKYLRSLGVSYGAEAGYRSPGEWLLR